MKQQIKITFEVSKENNISGIEMQSIETMLVDYYNAENVKITSSEVNS